MLRTILTGCGILFLASASLGATGQLASSTAQSAASPQRALLNRYCVTCHNERLQTAGLMLDRVDIEDVRAAAPIWEKVVRKLRTASMPPAGMPRPDAASYDSLATYIEVELDRAAAADPNPGRPAVHRLNRVEYANAIRDLLAVEIDGVTLLPADDAGHGFDNIAEMLSVSPLLVERYMFAARRITRLALGDPNVSPFTETYDVSRDLVQTGRMSEDLPLGSRGGIAVRHHFPLDGEYILTIRLQRNKDNYIIGLAEPHQLDVRLDGARIKLFPVGGEHRGVSGPLYSFILPDYRGDPEQERYELTTDADLEVRFPSKAGTRLVQVAFLHEIFEPEGKVMPRQLRDELTASGYKGGPPAVDQVSIRGPYDATGVGETASRAKILVCTPKGAGDEEACAREILSKLARRAYRRPVTEADLQVLLGFYNAGRRDGGFEVGIRGALQRILVSPEFLFRIERDPPDAVPDRPYRISDLELASRLSFFLWSSIPDDELLALAEHGKLKDPTVLKQQVKRMLDDVRSRMLVENFAGQWLSLRNLQDISPDPKVFPDFDDNLRQALREESELFFESTLREDRSLLDLLDADYTFLNERLAQHYGIPDVFGSHFRRVDLQNEERRGLLGQGSVLTVTSYSNRTAPTIRGKWLLDNIMGAPPPPPPPNVPSLREEDGEEGQVLTMRQRLEQHRANPVCAACHSHMDPLGFALENFDALGKWRTSVGGTPIDPSGQLPDGTEFRGPAELREILLSRREQFVITVTEKLLLYALGRGLEHYDQPVVRKIVRDAAPEGYRWSSLIEGIVESTPFQMRKTP